MKNLKLNIAILLCSFPLLQPNLHGEEPAKNPWHLRDVWRLQFEGNETFDADDIRDALALDGEVQVTVDPDRSLDDFHQAVLKRLQDGYRSLGFEKVSATITAEQGGQPLTIRITEGARYKSGPIRITGDSTVDAAAFRNAMMIKPLKDERNPAAGRTDEKIWVEGEHIQISEARMKELRKKTDRILREIGHHFPEYELSFVPNHETRQTELHIDLSDLGRRQPVSEIKFTGLTRHTEDEILDFLRLPKDLHATTQLTQRIERSLENTGRFVYVRAHIDEAFGPDHAVPLHVELLEYEKVPKLTEVVRGKQAALMQLARWLGKLPESGEDMHLTVSAKASENDIAAAMQQVSTHSLPAALQPREMQLDFCLSGKGGALVRYKARNLSNETIVDVSVLLTRQAAGLFDWREKRTWVSNGTAGGVVTTVSLMGQEADDEGHEFTCNFSGGINNNDRVPFSVTAMANPAALVDFFSEWSDEKNLPNGSVQYLSYEDAGKMEIDRETGRLLRLEISSDRGKLTAEGGTDLLQNAVAELRTQTAEWPNWRNEDRSTASFIRFVAAAVENTLKPAAADLPAAMPIVFRLLQDEAATYEFGDALSNIFGEGNFSIPSKT